MKAVAVLLCLSAACTSVIAASPMTDAQVTALAIQAAKDADIHQGIRSIKGSYDLGYSIVIEYNPAYFSSDLWKGREQAFANGDTYHLARSFVRVLVKDGHDPSSGHDAQIVQVCAQMPSPPSITGHPGVYDYGCSMYTPVGDAVSMNDKMNPSN